MTLLQPPEWIDDRAKEEFNILAEQMKDVLRPTDIYILADFCQCVSDIITLMEVLRVEGNTITHPESGAIKMNPNASLLLSRRQAMAQLRKDLGLTPAQRKERPTKGGAKGLKDTLKDGGGAKGDLL